MMMSMHDDKVFRISSLSVITEKDICLSSYRINVSEPKYSERKSCDLYA